MSGSGPGTAPTPTGQPVIDADGLVKTFGRGRSAVRALDGLDLTVPPGRIAGFLGPNGAGKTTTIRILLGLIRADGGRVRLLGGDPWEDRVELHRRLAYVPGDVALWPQMTGGQALDALAGLRGEDARDPSRRAVRDALVERFELDPSKRVRTYSKGNRQKVALVAALSADVELLVLDEPTSGLDPLMEATFRQCVAEFAGDGHAVLLSSHILAEVEKLCDTVTIIRAGRTVESGTLDDIRGIMRTEVRATLGGVAGGGSGPALAALAALPGVHDVALVGEDDATPGAAGEGGARAAGAGAPGTAGPTVRLTVEPAGLDALLSALAGLGVRGLVAAPPSLEELFLRHYGSDR